MAESARLAVVVCTYNRSNLLVETLESLYSDGYTGDEVIDILVVANNCNDDTIARLEVFRATHAQDRLKLAWLEEPTAGKSCALNSAIANTGSEILCFIDDDQIVQAGFLENLLDGIGQYPDEDILCGRIWPNWDGSEPSWVHAAEPYTIPVRPFPEFDLGKVSVRIGPGNRHPSGGNISVRRRVFEHVGNFSTSLGPTGHNLAGGEDHDFLQRATAKGFTIRYLPKVRQLHAIDAERMSTIYTLKKSYIRSRSSLVILAQETLPRLYMFRKVVAYFGSAIFTTDENRRLFYLVRLAASAGELTGSLELLRARGDSKWLRLRRSCGRLALAFVLVLFVLSECALAWALSDGSPSPALFPAFGTAAAGAMLLLAKSLFSYTQTGPEVRREILIHFRWYSILHLSRLIAIALVILFGQALLGALSYEGVAYLRRELVLPGWSTLASAIAIVLISGLQFFRQLLLLPASLMASSNYRMSRLYPFWRMLNPRRLDLAGSTLLLLGIALALFVGLAMASDDRRSGLLSLGTFLIAGGLLWGCLRPGRYPKPAPSMGRGSPPNILMIGSDTLRTDRIGPKLTPHIDRLARESTHFTHCYVPCARTAPSLISLLTGTWPHKHGVRDNFVADCDARLAHPALPELLHKHGYVTAALSDWCGSDMGKFSFGFDYTDLPTDQWNLKSFIRQGPKDLRLFLSLFTHNHFGKALFPEIHYLGGVPLTDELGVEAGNLLNVLARGGKPFLLNVFFSTTHPPFGSEYPYYTLYSAPEYAGESKFAMARLTDPWEILRQQAEPREAFDLDQIINLYDGCVRRFDDEVARILKHLDACAMSANTIVVIYSDHGMEFFEHDTWGQGNSAVSEHSARVPLVVRDPRVDHARRVDDVVRSVDLTPTLLDLLGLPIEPEMDGVSLASYVRDPQARLQLDAYNETGIWLADMPGLQPNHLRYPNLLEMLEVPDKATGTLALKPEYQQQVIVAKDRMLRRGRWKLVYQPLTTGSQIRLFDVEADPGCRRDVSAEHSEIYSELWSRMELIMQEDHFRRGSSIRPS